MSEVKEPSIVPLYVAFDVEKKGAKFEHPIIQIGVAYTNSLDVAPRTASFCFDYPGAPFEKRCYDEFWVKNLDILKRIQKEAKPAKAEWERFVDFLNALEKEHSKIKILSDNPAYDIEAIDWHLDKECGRAGIRYTSTGKYRPVIDSSEMVKGLSKSVRDAIQAKVDKAIQHTHWAPDDAQGILLHYLLTQSVINIQDQAEAAITTVLTE